MQVVVVGASDSGRGGDFVESQRESIAGGFCFARGLVAGGWWWVECGMWNVNEGRSVEKESNAVPACLGLGGRAWWWGERARRRLAGWGLVPEGPSELQQLGVVENESLPGRAWPGLVPTDFH